MKTGIAQIPLDYGHCPRWLFERMKKLSRSIALSIIEEFGAEEFLKRLSDPVWFQSFGCILGFDYNSSGLTVTTLGALKAGIFDIQDKLGIYICGGKKSSRKTPQEIETYGRSRQLHFFPKLIYASKITAKVDSSLLQDSYQLYHHNFLFTKSGSWLVIQQGMNVKNKTARRYHWISDNLLKKGGEPTFIEEPHSGIISAKINNNVLNLTSKKSELNREISLKQVLQEPKNIIKNLALILKSKNRPTLMVLENKEFFWHPIVNEKFDLKRLEKIISFVHSQKPQNFENLLSLKNVGPKTIRALSLISELIYGAKPSYQDPARYTFAHGGKDGTPFPVSLPIYDKTIELINKGIIKSKISIKEKDQAQYRLEKYFLN